MTVIVGLVSQKGGVGKSTLCRLIACGYAANGWQVKIADLDLAQQTNYRWNQRRHRNAIQPEITVEQFSTVNNAIRLAEAYDLMVLDGAPQNPKTTFHIAKASDLVILPTGIALDDLEPTVLLAHGLKRRGIPTQKIAIALCRVGTSELELKEAKAYLNGTEYFLLDAAIREKTGYRRAGDQGRALTETRYPTLNQKADRLLQAIADRIETLTQRRTHGHH